MKVGDKDSFAIEFELDQQYGGPWLFGKFCYWISGIKVGDYELGTSLRDLLFQMRWAVKDCGNRSGGILCDVTPEKAFLILDSLLYESEDSASTSEFPALDTPARFEISIPVDVFDQWKVYLIECDRIARILVRNSNEGVIKSATLPKGAFDLVTKEVFDRLNRLHDQEGGVHSSSGEL